MTASTASLSVYQLHIALRGLSPLIWRRVLVHSHTTLAHLHAILQILLTVGIDGGYVKAQGEQGTFEVIAGKSLTG